MAFALLSSLRARLLLLILLVALPLLALIFHTASRLEQAASEDARKGVLRLAEFVAQDERDLIDATHQLLLALAEVPAMADPASARCAAFAAHLLTHYTRYADIGVARPNGDVICSAVPLRHPVNAGDQEWFRRATESRAFAVGEYQVGRVTRRGVVVAALPGIDEQSRRITRVLFAGLELRWLGRFEAAVSRQLPPGSTLTKIDEDGIVLVRHPEGDSLVGRPLADGQLAQRAVAGQSAVIQRRDSSGVERITAFTPVLMTSGRLYLILSVPADAAFAAARRLRDSNLLALGAVVLLALVGAWLGSDVLVLRRLMRVVLAARRLGTGDLSARVGLPRGAGELNELGAAFDDMATSLQTREQALRESQARYRSLFEHVPVGVYRTAPDGRIEDANALLVELFGYPSLAALLETDATQLYANAEDRDRWQATMEREGLVRDFEMEGRRHDGRHIWVRSSARAVRDQQGRITHYEGIVEDITERRLAEQLARQNEKLAEMGALLAGVAHELNNPLSVVAGQAGLLAQAAGGGPLSARAEKIVQAADRCGRIVKNFLALARQHPPERAVVDLNKIVRDAVELLAYQLRVGTVDVRLDLGTLPALWADGHELHQVAVNLITNALHAMREASGPRRLTLTTRAAADQRGVHLEVADTGPGIPPDLQARLFEPFFTTKEAGEGTGLGLSICRGIVEGHHGTIRVESEPGRGAVFIVDLPVQVAPPGAGTPELSALSQRGTGRILLVDDEPEIVGLLSDMLAMDGHRVESATSGVEALEKLQGATFDVIISDCRMPAMDGPTLFREATRRDGRLAGAFIFVTGDLLSRETRDALEATHAPTLSKPFDWEAVRRAVEGRLTRPRGGQ